jgi:hypothetical protein
MMSKIKILFLMVLCLGVTSATTNVSAQTGDDKVLISAGGKSLKQSDINQIIEFYEWAFQTRFTNEQRAQYRQLKESEFRRNPAEAKKGNDEVRGFLPQINSSSQSEKERVRNAFNASFVSQLRKTTDDAEVKFLLGVYDAANGGETAAGDTINSANSSDSLIGDLSTLVGKWVWSRTGSGNWNGATGAYVGGNGSRFTYSFASDGAVEYTGIMNVMMGGCSQQVFMQKKGRASVQGNTLTIRWSGGTSTRDFSCDRANNYTKNLPAETETLKINLTSNSTGQKLFCVGAEGKEQTCFSPTN